MKLLKIPLNMLHNVMILKSKGTPVAFFQG